MQTRKRPCNEAPSAVRPAGAAGTGRRAGEPPGVSTTRIPAVPGDDGSSRATQARSEADSSEPDIVLGRYRLARRLGAGAFATVYAARDERLARDVALKVMPPSVARGDRFAAEARAAARLSHPAIVTLYEAAADADGSYLVSELVRGSTLSRLLDSGKLSDRDLLRIAVAIADALAHAHAHGVIHRDVKPSNVLIPARRGGDTPAAKLTDFGVAQVLGGDSPARAGEVVGTRDYMPPEQAAGRVAGPEADLYALALVVYEALTGVNPVRAMRVDGRRHRLGVHVPPLRHHRRDLPRVLGGAIDRALRPRPSERGELAELRAALLACLPDVADEATRRASVPGTARRASVPRPAPRRTAPGAAAADAGEWRAGRAAAPQAGGTKGRSVRVPERGFAALAAALTSWWLCGHLLTRPPAAPALLGLIAAAAVLVAPRLGAAALFLLFAGLAIIDGRPGGAVVLAALAGATIVALAGAGRLWPAPAGAAALGLLGLGTAWPAVAGMSGMSLPRRAGLAAAGFIWAGAAGALIRAPVPWLAPHLPAPSAWTRSVTLALDRVVTGPGGHVTVAALAVWAAAAALLPLLVTRLRPVAAIVGVAFWSGAVVAATEAVGARPLDGAALGAVCGGLLAASGPLAALARAALLRADGEAVP